MILALAQSTAATTPTSEPTTAETSTSSSGVDGAVAATGALTKRPTNDGNTLFTECTDFIKSALDAIIYFEWMETMSFAVAIALLAATGAVAVWKEWKKTPDQQERIAARQADAAPASIVDLLKALPELIKSLSSAPAAVVLLILGLLMSWHTHQKVETPPACEVVIEQGLLTQ